MVWDICSRRNSGLQRQPPSSSDPIALQPVQTESYYQLGQIALDEHRDADADGLFQRTLARSATHGGALTGEGELAYRRKDYAQAKVYLKRAVEAAPEYQPAHYYLGLTLNRLGDAAESARELKVAEALTAKQQGKSQPLPQGQVR